MRFGIVGAGGIGGFLAARLMAGGEDVALLARGAHLEAIKSNGLRILDPDGDITVHPEIGADASVLGAPDVIVLAVKGHQLEDAISQIAPVVGADTRVVPFQNGVDAPEMVARAFGSDHAWMGTARVFANITAPGEITRYGAPKSFTFGTLDGAQKDPQLVETQRRWRAAGIDAPSHDDVRVELWTKFVIFNVASSLTAAARQRFGVLRQHPETVELAKRLLSEGIAVAHASGVPLPDEVFDTVLDGFMNVWPAEGWTSTAHDITQGRALEIDYTCGAVARRGRALGVDVTASETIYAVLSPWKKGVP